jgi:dipeptidyl aminopeptidase/acylaminoacyl peptidase
MAPLLDRQSDRLIGWADSEQDVRFLDPALQNRWTEVLHTFEDERVSLTSMSDDSKQFVVLVDGDRDGYAYKLVEPDSHRVTSIGPVYTDLPELSDVQRITYPAADGLEITAFATFPHGRPPRRLPLVVFPHGGPAFHDDGGFDWWAQAMAARGYLILQPNYRGSDSDERLLSAGFGEWGRKMQTDLSDGVRFLVQKGVADPTRVCIVGASYGGYAALAGVPLDTGVYRCAVSVGGISDLSRFVKSRSAQRYRANERYWDRFLGVSGPRDSKLEALSPIQYAAAVTAPTMLIHGRDDTVVAYEQSATMATALERAGKPVDLVALDGEDHWLSRSATRLRMLEYVLAFLAANNPAE